MQLVEFRRSTQIFCQIITNVLHSVNKHFGHFFAVANLRSLQIASNFNEVLNEVAIYFWVRIISDNHIPKNKVSFLHLSRQCWKF